MTEKEIFCKYKKAHNSKLDCDLGEIIIEKQLGESNHSLVYSVKLNSSSFAMKVLLDANVKQRERFKAEFINLASLTLEDFFVKSFYYGIFNVDGNKIAFTLMPLWGKDIKKDGIKSENYLAFQNFLLDAVENLHNSGIIHRDLKPENILVKEGIYKIADFGIAHYSDEFIMSGLTHEKDHERLANYQFSPREQYIDKGPAKITMDIFALGKILYWAITENVCAGIPDFTGINLGNYPQYAKDLILKCMQDNPKYRFQSIKEIRQYIEKAKDRSLWDYIIEFNQIFPQVYPHIRDNTTYVANTTAELSRFVRLLTASLSEGNVKPHFMYFDVNDNSLNRSPGDDIVRSINILGNNLIKINSWTLFVSDFILFKSDAAYKTFALFNVLDQEHPEHYAIYNKTIKISTEEAENGYAEIEGNVTKLDIEKIELFHPMNKSVWLVSSEGGPATYDIDCSFKLASSCYSNKVEFVKSKAHDIIWEPKWKCPNEIEWGK